MSTLYVTLPGARLEKEYQRIAVVKDDERLMRVRLAQISDVVLIGAVGITTQAMIALLDAGVPLSIIRTSGRLIGRLTPPTFRNLPLRHQQYHQATNPGFCLAIGKAIVGGKLRNQRTLVRRIFRSRATEEKGLVETINRALFQVRSAPDLASLRGLEGSAAKAYFQVIRSILPPGWEVTRRERRPPRDPFNALLSFGYTLLGQNMHTALEIAGLDPYDGFFHADKYGRPALSLDLMEEFRSLIVDSVVLTVISKRILRTSDFEKGSDGVYLRPRALRKFLIQYSARLQTEVFHPYAGKRLTYQKCMEVQARIMRKVIEGELLQYQPFLTK